jgi:hypothetical protein
LQISFKHGKAASYQTDKALSQTKVNRIHLHLRGRKFEMRNFRNAVTALVLALVFAAPAFADGIINTDKVPPPPPPPPSATGIMYPELTDGIINTDVAAPAPETTDSTTEIALNLLQTALTLL